mmetsp:Transcript_104778/g.190653  ORF Transcript_104778/g.190653 Transcript_104778/m.190653 type:complete len:309 (-) Transcript_104778:1016-1942(-)
MLELATGGAVAELEHRSGATSSNSRILLLPESILMTFTARKATQATAAAARRPKPASMATKPVGCRTRCQREFSSMRTRLSLRMPFEYSYFCGWMSTDKSRMSNPTTMPSLSKSCVSQNFAACSTRRETSAVSIGMSGKFIFNAISFIVSFPLPKASFVSELMLQLMSSDGICARAIMPSPMNAGCPAGAGAGASKPAALNSLIFCCALSVVCNFAIANQAVLNNARNSRWLSAMHDLRSMLMSILPVSLLVMSREVPCTKKPIKEPSMTSSKISGGGMPSGNWSSMLPPFSSRILRTVVPMSFPNSP